MQKLEDAKNSWKLVRPKEIVEVFRNLKKMAQTFANTTQKLEFCQISNPTKQTDGILKGSLIVNCLHVQR